MSMSSSWIDWNRSRPRAQIIADRFVIAVLSGERGLQEGHSRCETVEPDPRNTGVKIVVDESITVREFRESDAEDLFKLVDGNRLRLRKWFPWVDQQICVGNSLDFIIAARARRRLGAGLTVCVVMHQRIVGEISLRMIDQTGRQALMGYWVGAEAEGRGMMSSSCRKVFEYGFETLGLHRVVLRAAKENRRSRKLAERLGFGEIGSGSQSESLLGPGIDLGPDHGPDVELVSYSLNAADWQR